jgi:hypothetical protein
MYKVRNKQRGFIRWILVLAIALIVGSYFFDFSIQEAVEDEQTQDNFNYIKTHVIDFWNDHLAVTAHYLWDDVFIELIWSGFVDNIGNLNMGGHTLLEDSAPGVDILPN